jgi:glycosidase
MKLKQLFNFLLCTFALILTTTSCHKKEAVANASVLDSIDYEKKVPEWASHANIYEVNVRQYTPEGTFKAFQQHLPRLKQMGVEILWLMPINPIGEKNRKGSLGSYYSVKNYTAVNPEFGTEADLKNLVAEAHKQGMHVIIDWVANHTAWDNVWVKDHPDWYTKDSLGHFTPPAGTDWADVIDLNYDNAELRKAMIDAMSYWVKNCDIDGFRCDVAGMVPLSFWQHARKAIDELKPGCFFLAEDGEPRIHKAFDMTYDWQLKDVMNDMAKGKKDVTDLIKLFESEAKKFKIDDLRMQFTTNHDENTWSGTEYERLGAKAVDAFTVLTYMVPGIPLTYTGQEEPMNKRLRFFDKDTVGFKNYARQSFIQKLNQLKAGNKGLWSPSYRNSFMGLRNSNPKNVLTFIRFFKKTQVFCAINFSDKEQAFQISDMINGEFSLYMGENIVVKRNETVHLKPWSYAIETCMN